MKKQVLRRFTYGLYVVTAAKGDDYAAATITWLSQASFEPPLIMLAMQNGSHILEMCQKAGTCAVHVVGKGQEKIASTFFKPAQVVDDTLSSYGFKTSSVAGAPLLVDLPAWCEVEVKESYPVGDHTLLIAEIVNTGLSDDKMAPLALGDTPWHYGG
jgi:flavin reductase (DIM6/NTAB) family NADH-FMN oxidoreductase RutF